MKQPVVLEVVTTAREEFIEITGRLAQVVRDQGLDDGVLFVHCPHTTCGLTINEHADPDVARDLLKALARLAPRDGDYLHAEGNSDAHLKAALMGCGLTVHVSGGKLLLGGWQGAFLCEFDGPRKRQLYVRAAALG